MKTKCARDNACDNYCHIVMLGANDKCYCVCLVKQSKDKIMSQTLCSCIIKNDIYTQVNDHKETSRSYSGQ